MFGVYRTHPVTGERTTDVQIFPTRSSADLWVHYFNLGTYRIVVRDVGEWIDE